MRIAQLMNRRGEREREREGFIAKQMCRLHGPMQFDSVALDPDPEPDRDPPDPVEQSPTARLPGFQA